MSRRSAPRSEVVRQWKTGSYATTVWYSELSCGHVDQRRRRPVAAFAACLQCEAQAAVDVAAVPAMIRPTPSIDNDVAILKVQLAAAMGVTPDSVAIEVQGDRMAGARILLDPAQVREIVSQFTQPPER